ncbi:MAG: tRNA ((46)-N7)-methyltransferase TrmB, partial [Bacteroidota bacterium]
GKWATDYFKNNNPIVLELACGKGEYALGLAQINADRNYIGIDMKGNRIWKGAKTAIEQNLNQVAFLRTYIEWLDEFFAEGEVDEIWITFSDPFLSTTKAQKRLTSPRYLAIYAKVLKHGATLNLKTDDDTLYQYTLDVLAGKEAIEKYPCDVSKFKLIESRNDIYNDGKEVNEALQIKTYYEQKHLQIGKKIKYVKMQFQSA